MRSGPPLAIAALVAALLALPVATAGAASAPPAKTTTRDGPVGRYLLSGGGWLFRSDPHRRGERRRYPSRPSKRGWRRIRVPNAWNAGSTSNASMRGGTVWYRKDFRLPRASASDWLVSFESVRYRAKVWLNGHLLGKHEGAYLPFEFHLRGLKRGTNRLVVQVDNRMHATDLPPGKVTVEGAPNGGWWNWGGILRDVYLRRVRGIDISQTQVLPRVKCQRCSASIAYRVTVRNYRRRAARVRVTTRFGSKRATIGVGRVRGGSARRFSGSVKIAKPKLWSPPHPTLYPVKISASGGGSASWSIHSGVRQFTVRGGRLLLNGLPVNLRGVFLHEDGPGTGGAVTHGRMNLFFKLAHQIGATALRTHYPMSPYIKEQADRRGFLIWEEVPVFQVSSKIMRKSAVRKKAIRMVRADILANSNHPSVFTWSVANELPVETTAVEARYFRESARAAHRLDPTRPVSTATPGYASVGCRKAFKPLDLLGVNTYFGWYPGRMGALADRTKLGPFLDQARRCYPKLALMVTEFGAEANRNGPPEDRGTYAFQAKLNDFDLWTYSQKPWLSGAIGMLIEFHVRPGWFGGNPFPTQPLHQKAVFDFFGRPKPAAAVLSRWFHRTQQYDLPPGT